MGQETLMSAAHLPSLKDLVGNPNRFIKLDHGPVSYRARSLLAKKLATIMVANKDVWRSA
jgi:hypothetical protein